MAKQFTIKKINLRKPLSERIISQTGNIAKYSIEILLYFLYILLKFTAKVLYKFKYQLYKLSLAIGVIAFLLSHFTTFTTAPTTAQAMDGFHTFTTPKTEHDYIVQYIDQTFGEYAPKAYKLLRCENSKLDPQAVNTFGNYPVGSKDIGVFMINEYWQKIQAKFLFNWKINIEIAKQLFDENNHSFKLWTCGKELVI